MLLHGAFMVISGNWSDWIKEISKTRKVIAIEIQGHGRTADIKRDLTYENISDDVAGLLDYLKISSADIIGYSMGGGVTIQCAIRHPDKVRKVVSISAPIRRDGWVKEANDVWQNLTREVFKVTPMEFEYKRLSPMPDKFSDFFNYVKALALKPYDFGADKLRDNQSTDVFHSRRCRWRMARAHLGYVAPEGRRDFRRHGTALDIEIIHFAQHNTRHVAGAHDRYRPAGQRLSQCEIPIATHT